MVEIGRRAGVGQATLYRHFSDRTAVIAAIAGEHVERIELVAHEDADEGRALLAALEAGVGMLVSIQDIVAILRSDAALAPLLAELRARVRIALDGTLAAARAARIVGNEVETDDLVLVLQMVNGAVSGLASERERAATAARALELALDGLRPHGG